jgi:hypothetical protein
VSVTILFMLGLFLSVLGLIEIGRRIGLSRMAEETERARAGLGAIEAAIYGLLALMIAFTFSGAASRLDARRALVVQEANAIGTAYLRLDLLPAAAQPALREQFSRYTETRLAVFRALPDNEAADAQAAKAGSLQKEIWAGAIPACVERDDRYHDYQSRGVEDAHSPDHYGRAHLIGAVLFAVGWLWVS